MKQTTWITYTHEQMQELKDITERYKSCLDAGKTERECVELSIRMAEKAGYRDLKAVMAAGEKLKAGDKIYAVNMDKMLALFRIGEEPLSAGMNILGAHIDSPRIDVKQNPLYENEGFAYLDTHYYGGIKKYQWVAQPLSLHGVIVKKDGTVQKVAIGEDESDPVFVITDLLVHLAQEQLEKKASKVIDGEKLDLLIGNCPLDGAVEDKEQKEAVKANILKLLKDKYDMEEEDFSSAELEIVPAGRARDCGMDRSMILSYGQDDRVCAFTSLFARRALMNSRMLSSDVSAAYDPMFAEAFEKRSSAFFAKGITFNKFTGSRGKSGSNDANAEYIAALRKAMDDAGVAYQFAELGRVDLGGGGTIAYIMANYGMEVIDSGVAVLNMHAPYEVSSKADVYEAVKGYRAFLRM